MIKQIKKDIGILDIKDDFIISDDGRAAAVFSVKPIDFSEKEKDEQLKIVCNYRIWLDSLEYPVQIIKRAVNFDIKEHMLVLKTTTESELKKRKKDSHEALNSFREFYSWLAKHVDSNCVNKNLFYLVIPYLGDSKKEIQKEWKNVKAALEKRCEDSRKLLEKTGVKISRMDEDELENLFSSYFGLFFMQEKVNSYDDMQSFAKLWLMGDKNV